MVQKRMKQRAKLDIGSLQSIVLIIALVALIASFTLQILGDTRDDIGEDNCADRTDGFTTYDAATHDCKNSTGSHLAVGSAEFNATEDGIVGVAKIPEKLPILVTVIVAAIIIGTLVTYFATSRR